MNKSDIKQRGSRNRFLHTQGCMRTIDLHVGINYLNIYNVSKSRVDALQLVRDIGNQIIYAIVYYEINVYL